MNETMKTTRGSLRIDVMRMLAFVGVSLSLVATVACPPFGGQLGDSGESRDAFDSSDAMSVETVAGDLTEQDSASDLNDGATLNPTDQEFCPAYESSSLFRERAVQLVVGPLDDWIGAIEGAEPSTEVLLRDGTYHLGDTYAVVVGPSVTIRSQSGSRDSVIIRGAGYGPGGEGFMIMGADVTVADLSMTQIRNHAISIKGNTAPHAIQIYNVHVFDIGTQHIKLTPGGTEDGLIACSSVGYSEGGAVGDYVNAIDLHEALDWHIRDNLIYNITGDGSGCEVDIDCGTYVSGPAVLVWNNSRGTLIERNTIVDSFRNIALGLGSGHEDGVVRNNFIYRLGPGDAGIELWDAHGSGIYHNTVLIADYPGAIEFRQSSDLSILNNLISQPIWDRGESNVWTDANIEDASAADFVAPGDVHLTDGSRAIGAGITVEQVIADIDGDMRDGRYDVGADHFSP